MSAKCSLCAAVAQGMLTDSLVLCTANAAAVPAANADDHAAADACPASPAAGSATCSSGTGAAVSRAGNACHHRMYLALIFYADMQCTCVHSCVAAVSLYDLCIQASVNYEISLACLVSCDNTSSKYLYRLCSTRLKPPKLSSRHSKKQRLANALKQRLPVQLQHV